MRFIRGANLIVAVQEFHKQRPGSARPMAASAFQSVPFRKLLGRFNDVCDAIAYAHSRGILHRDLKPGNIMLGKYGETLVVDWGLAKVIGKPELATDTSEATLRPSSGSSVPGTLAGSFLGTPYFMSPEAAAGRWDSIG